jgi:hypothetical protein
LKKINKAQKLGKRYYINVYRALFLYIKEHRKAHIKFVII